jgi:hypothetical protein
VYYRQRDRVLRRIDFVLRAVLQRWICTGLHGRVRTRLLQRRVRTDVYSGIRAGIHNELRTRVHDLLLGRLFELLRSGRVHHGLLRRMVSGLLGRSSSHARVGFADRLCCRVSHQLRRGVRTEHLLVVPGRICHELRSRLLELFGVLGFAV